MWFIENIGSILVGLGIAGLIALIIITNVKNKRKGKSNCGCGCSNCSMSEICHKTQEETQDNK